MGVALCYLKTWKLFLGNPPLRKEKKRNLNVNNKILFILFTVQLNRVSRSCMVTFHPVTTGATYDYKILPSRGEVTEWHSQVPSQTSLGQHSKTERPGIRLVRLALNDNLWQENYSPEMSLLKFRMIGVVCQSVEERRWRNRRKPTRCDLKKKKKKMWYFSIKRQWVFLDRMHSWLIPPKDWFVIVFNPPRIISFISRYIRITHLISFKYSLLQSAQQ